MSAKLTPQQVIYFESGGPSRCGRCVMFLSDTSECAILTNGFKVDGENGVCQLFVPGPPTSEDEHGPPGESLTPEEAGYGTNPGGFRCGNCEYGSGRPRCVHPSLSNFPISNESGCCTAWEKNEREGVSMAKDGKLKSAMSEVMHDEPSTVTRANVSGKQKQKMKVAIAYAKARKAGASLPKK